MSAVPSIGRAEVAAALLDAHAEAAERLYDRHHRSVFAFCLSQLRDREDAADAVQTTFMHALRALRRGVTPSFEVPWLLAIARNVCRTRGAERTRRRHLELALDPQELADAAPAPERAELLSGIEDALARLPEQQRRAVVLRDWQGLSYKEIADQLGVSLAAAETLIFRGRGALARELSGDETRKRRFSLGSLLGLLRSPAFGGGAGAAAKVAVGAAVVVGAGVAGTKELAHRPPVSPPPARVAPDARPHGEVVVSAPVVAPAKRLALPARRHVVLRRRAQPHVVATAKPKPEPRGRARALPPRAHSRHAARTKPSPDAAVTPAVPVPAPAAAAVPAAAAPPAAAPAPTPPGPAPTPGAPAASAPAPRAPAVPSSEQPAAAPSPVRPAPAPAPDPAPAAPADPVTAVATPVATTATQAAPPAAPVVEPVVTTVTAVAQPVAPVVTTVTNAVTPVVPTAVTQPAAPVVTAVTNIVTPVVTNVTSVLPPPPPLPHLP